MDTVERSKSIRGTNDWQRLEFMFNSKNRDKVKIGFGLGGYDSDCSGDVWFSDFKLERGAATESSEWKFGCFIFDNIDVDVNNKHIKLQISTEDKTQVSQNMARFKNACKELSRI